MLYALLCYDDEEVTSAWSAEHDAAVMAELEAVHAPMAARGRLGPVARLMPTTTATTLRNGAEPLVLDGPFAETKEQLLGFYIVDVDTLDAAIEFARELGVAKGSTGAYEIRPLILFRPGSAGA